MKKLLALFLIFGMNFAYAGLQKLEPMPDSAFESTDPNVILQTSARCAALFLVLSVEFKEPKLRMASNKFIYLANNIGLDDSFVQSVVSSETNATIAFYMKEAKKEKSAVAQSDMWKCPNLLYRFGLR